MLRVHDKSITVANIKSEYKGYPVTSIVDHAFSGCKSLTAVTIPDSVTSIGSWAFSDCISLTAVTIGDSVTSIGGYAFKNCTSLTAVTIPGSVTSIGYRAFGYYFGENGKFLKVENFTIYGYTGSEAETYANKNEIKFVALDDRRSDTDDEIVYGINEEKGIAYVESASTSLTVANIKSEYKGYRVTGIEDDAFSYCTSLTAVTIPDSVTWIGDCAFSDCKSLKSITIPDSVTSIGYGAFSSCELLVTVTTPNSVTSIGESAFSGCKSLTSVTIPSSVTSIGDEAFSHCTSLTTITIPDSVTNIGTFAFSYCTSLTSVECSETFPEINGYSFTGCTSLKEIRVRGDNKYTTINGVVFSKDKKVLVYYPAGKDATSYVVPDGVEEIDYGAFLSCKNLESITFPESVKRVNEHALSDCSTLASVTFFGRDVDIWWSDPVDEIGKLKECRGYGGTKVEQFAKDLELSFVAIG